MTDFTPPTRLNAKEAAVVFGRSLRGDKWYLASLVAMYVKPGKAGRPKKSDKPVDVLQSAAAEVGKISASAFARFAGVATKTVLKYLAAWERAAEDGMVPAPKALGPFSDVDDVMTALIEHGDGETIESVGKLEDFFPKAEPAAVEEVSQEEAESEAQERSAAQDEAAVGADTEEFLKLRADEAEETAHGEAVVAGIAAELSVPVRASVELGEAVSAVENALKLATEAEREAVVEALQAEYDRLGALLAKAKSGSLTLTFDMTDVALAG